MTCINDFPDASIEFVDDVLQLNMIRVKSIVWESPTHCYATTDDGRRIPIYFTAEEQIVFKEPNYDLMSKDEVEKEAHHRGRVGKFINEVDL